MAEYRSIDTSTVDGRRTVDRLLSLKGLLTEKKRIPKDKKKGPKDDKKGTKDDKKRGLGVPAKTLGRSLLLATWNIREFGRNAKFGPRLVESLYYIAEIISAFDIVAVQEVNENLGDLFRLMKLLGPDWQVLLTDITLGRHGNGERMVFLYDGRKIRFEGLASQIVVPPEVVKGKKKYNPARQLSRTPMMVGFRCNWFKFTLCTAHIYYGTSKPDDPTRIQEIRILADILAKRVESKHAWAPNMIVLGDFNIFRPEDTTARALEDENFFIPPQIKNFEAGETGKHYDQIAFRSSRYDKQTRRDASKAKAGVVTFFDKVFKDEDEKLYAKHMGAKYRTAPSKKAKTTVYRQWRTFQMSDHRLLWIELPADFSLPTLASMRNKAKGAGGRKRFSMPKKGTR